MAVIETLSPKPVVDYSTCAGITHALRGWHTERGEICMAEVGAGRSGKRLDFWAMRPSWSRPLPTGYEIKVSVSDFKGDKKWHLYLPYCERLYFACPEGLLNVGDMPAEAGLVWINSSGSRTVQKTAKHRTLQEKYKNELLQRLLYRYAWKGGSLNQPW